MSPERPENKLELSPVAAPPAAGTAAGGNFSERAKEPSAVLLARDIVRWLIPAVGKFPKNLRYGLGSRIEQAALDVLELLVAAQYASGRIREESLVRGNLRLQSTRHLTRVAVELGVLTERQSLHVAKLYTDLGMQVGAWRKASVGTANSSPGSSIPRT